MSKLPAIQFYPGDWKKDPGVQALDFETRGIWFEIILLMHESEEYGALLLNGRPMPDDALANLLRLDNGRLTTSLTKILEYGVAARRESDGALTCRRMLRDENIRQKRREGGKLGGNPALLKGKDKRKVNQKETTQDNQNPTPSSSSSSSDNPPNPQGGMEPKANPNLPTSEPAQRIASLFSRRLTTPWSKKEVKAFKAIGPIESADLDVIFRYYAAERAKGDTGPEGGRHRRDLATFLNNFTGELDRARASVATAGKPCTGVKMV